VRAVLDLRVGFAGEVVDLVLTFLGAGQVVGQTNDLLAVAFGGRCETQQTGNFSLLAKSSAGPSFMT